MTFTFDEAVTGFALGDVVVTNANKASSWKSSSATTYTLTLTPTATPGQENTVTINVAVDAAMDEAGNGNVAATEARIIVDKILPTVTGFNGYPSGEENEAFDLTITFSEDVSDFAVEDLTVTGEASATAVAAVSGSESTYTVTITPNASSESDVTIQVKANAVVDKARNQNPLSSVSNPVHIDTIVPTVSVSDFPEDGAERAL